jgi:hypothetical protein
LFEVLFGTFHNPREFVGEQDFYDGASARVPAMLAFRDESSPPEIAVTGAVLQSRSN